MIYVIIAVLWLVGLYSTKDTPEANRLIKKNIDSGLIPAFFTIILLVVMMPIFGFYVIVILFAKMVRR